MACTATPTPPVSCVKPTEKLEGRTVHDNMPILNYNHFSARLFHVKFIVILYDLIPHKCRLNPQKALDDMHDIPHERTGWWCRILFVIVKMPRSQLHVKPPRNSHVQLRFSQNRAERGSYGIYVANMGPTLKKKIEWIIHSIYGVKRFHSGRVKILLNEYVRHIHSKRSDHWSLPDFLKRVRGCRGVYQWHLLEACHVRPVTATLIL